MEHTHTEQHEGGGTKEIWKVTIILTVLTIIELGLGFWMMDMPLQSSLRLAVKGAIVILMMVKAFYIVAYFMHLKHEIKNFTLKNPNFISPFFIFNSFDHLLF